MGFFDVFKNITKRDVSSGAPQKLTTEDFRVAGVNYYQGNVEKLACCNPEWKDKNATIVNNGNSGKKIYRYNYINKPVKLLEEPTNPHDKDAIRVVIAGELVGYIPRENCPHVKEILGRHEIKYISSFIYGGQYKVIYDAKNAVKQDSDIAINIRIAYI